MSNVLRIEHFEFEADAADDVFFVDLRLVCTGAQLRRLQAFLDEQTPSGPIDAIEDD